MSNTSVPNSNKVEFGISNLWVGTYSESGSTATLGTPYHQAGARSLTLDAETSENKYYADDVVYWSDYSDNGFSGELTCALFSDEFKTTFMGYVELSDGGFAQVKNATKPNTYIMFEGKGDSKHRRFILLNVSLGAISREYSTVEENKEPVEEKIPITVVGSNITGITRVAYTQGATGYSGLCTSTAPTAPSLPA